MKKININSDAIFAWSVLGIVFLIGGATGKTMAEVKAYNCENPRQVIALRGSKTQFFVYDCADGQYRTYDTPLMNAIDELDESDEVTR